MNVIIPLGGIGIAFFKCKSKKDLKEMYETTLNRKLYHPKTINKQEKQNNYYNTL